MYFSPVNFTNAPVQSEENEKIMYNVAKLQNPKCLAMVV